MVKFEVGKWYKRSDYENLPGYLKYIKLKYIREDRCYYMDRINGDGKYIGYSTENWCSSKNLTEATLTEIQQYLPKGHPDLQLNLTYELW